MPSNWCKKEAVMKKRRWIWVIALLAIVGGGFTAVVLPTLNQKPVYETYEVVTTDVIKTVSANGQLAESQLLAYGPAEEPILISANGSLSIPAQFGLSLQVESIAVELGDEVKADDLLFTYLNQLGQEQEVFAVSDGVVRSVDTREGLRTGAAVLTVGSADPVVAVYVSEYDADLVDLDQVVSIELDAINAVFEGKVFGIGQVAQSVSGIKQYEVLVSVDSLPSGARFGMSATAEIEVRKASGVLAVPTNSFVGTDKAEVEVLIVDAEGNETVKTVELKLGLLGDSFVEVISGLEVGDLVVTGISGSIPAPVNFGPPPGARESA